MQPALDEASLVTCPIRTPAERIRALAESLRALDELGAPRVLRSVRDAADRDLRDGGGLRRWCFDRLTQREAGILVAQRLGKAPYIDGVNGLFATSEGARVVEPTIGGVCSLGGGYVALTDGLLVLLGGSTWPPSKPVVVRLAVLTEDDEQTEEVIVDAADCAEEVNAVADSVERKIHAAVSNGRVLVDRLPELFPRIVLGSRASEQVAELTGTEPFFHQLLRHLRALDRAAERWTPGTTFSPAGVTHSAESQATLNHGTYGPLRDFPTPSGFSDGRWSMHTKITGGNGARLYFKAQAIRDTALGDTPSGPSLIAVGYVGPHLPTVKYH